MDELALFTSIFLFLAVIFYVVLLVEKYPTLKDDNLLRIKILNLRIPMFIPLYSILIYIALCVPLLFGGMLILFSIVSGYVIYCFFVLLVTNLGGPVNAVKMLNSSNKLLWCESSCCIPSCKLSFYRAATRAMQYCFWIRPIAFIISALIFYLEIFTSTSEGEKKAYRSIALLAVELGISLLAVSLLINSAVHLECLCTIKCSLFVCTN